jgi:hypothetical protein
MDRWTNGGGSIFAPVSESGSWGAGWLVACGDGHGRSRYLELVEVIYGRLM